MATSATRLELQTLRVADGRVETPLAVGTGVERLWYAADGSALDAAPEPVVVAALPLAMRLGAPIEVADPISARLLDALPTVQAILSAWDARHQIVEVSATRDERAGTVSARSAAFFTGGVDSWYTALRHRDSLDALVYVHGFDIALSDTARREQISSWLHESAAALDLPLVEVETNLRELASPICGWHLYHGAALASVALLLGGEFDRVMLPATHTYRDLVPLGSHPLLDPLWSTESVEIVHEGAANRVDKLAVVTAFDPAFRSLRACWQEDTTGFNCGRCEKCLRTMAGLRLLGVLEDAPTFPGRLSLRRLSRLAVSPGKLAYAHENLDAAARYGPDAQLERALRRLIRRGPRRYARQERIKRMRRSLRRRRRRAARRLRR